MFAWMLLAPRLADRWLVQLLLQLLLINSLVMTLRANPGWDRIRHTMVGLWVVSLLGSLLTLLPLAPAMQQLARTVENASVLPLLGILIAGILRYVFTRRELNVQGLFATIAVYLFIAFFFANVYVLMLEWNPASFHLPAEISGRPLQLLQGDMIYFSMITLATVGYGDILPVSETARSLAVIEAVVGQFYVAIVVAVFVGMYAAAQQRRE
jgi:voltage-gated potassium channel Kch